MAIPVQLGPEKRLVNVNFPSGLVVASLLFIGAADNLDVKFSFSTELAPSRAEWIDITLPDENDHRYSLRPDKLLPILESAPTRDMVSALYFWTVMENTDDIEGSLAKASTLFINFSAISAFFLEQIAPVVPDTYTIRVKFSIPPGVDTSTSTLVYVIKRTSGLGLPPDLQHLATATTLAQAEENLFIIQDHGYTDAYIDTEILTVHIIHNISYFVEVSRIRRDHGEYVNDDRYSSRQLLFNASTDIAESARSFTILMNIGAERLSWLDLLDNVD